MQELTIQVFSNIQRRNVRK